MEYAFSTRSLLPQAVPIGVGAVPVGSHTPAKHKQPHSRGVGAAVGTFTPTVPVKANWVLAYAYGDQAARVKIAGHGFRYAQVLQNFIASKAPASYFYYTGDGGTFLFSCIYSGATPVVRLATNGLRNIGLGRPPTGLGLAAGTIKPLSSVPGCTNWVPINPGDGSTASTNIAATLGANLSAILDAVGPAWLTNAGASGGPWTRLNGAYHFLYGSTVVLTAGETGAMLMKYDGGTLYGCTALASAAPSPAPSPPIQSSPPPVSSTDQGTYQWNAYMWQYIASSTTDIPTQPPPGQTPNGMWVNTHGAYQFDWYPSSQGAADGTKTITDPSGNTWYVYCSGYGANGEGASASYSPPAPGSTTPPVALAGTSGSWSSQIHPYYQVWLPTSGMSTDEEIVLVLLGLLVIGGGTYYLMQ